MKKLTVAEIREKFLAFFHKHGHEIVPSSSLVVADDQTLLFANSGMVQFKNVFLGQEQRPYSRATTAQKCLRVSGKHNDLEEVGPSPRHHTFFEMLGNFSFGDYFKEQAIRMAWELLIEELQLPVERLWFTIFEGDAEVPADEEAAQLWREVGAPAERILRFGRSDNFWVMADTGPCGPCSEITVYIGDDLSKMRPEGVNSDDPDYVEIWNLVFMQFERPEKTAPLSPLPKPSIDTGAGLERLAVVLQGKQSNYEIDLFERLLQSISEVAEKPYRGTDEPDDVSMRVIADHARATAFLVADGVQPDRGDREYVLRRIMRRAIRHGDRLGFKDVFLYRACLEVVSIMGEAYPELERSAALIEKVAQQEETSFRRTLSRGVKLLEERLDENREEDALGIDPKFVATLYDTYGFPIDLTRVMVEERGGTVDEEAAQGALRVLQAGQPGAQLTGSTSAIDKLWFQLRDEHGPSRFLGYETQAASGTVQSIVVEGATAEKVSSGAKAVVVLDQTPFYGESGGQIGDTGLLEWPGGCAEVLDTTKPLPELHAHHIEVKKGTLPVGQALKGTVDSARLDATRRNHSATHLLHLALREVLGDHVQQKGSSVGPDRLRFDYAHFEPLTTDQLEAVEKRVNELVVANRDTVAEVRSIEDAKAEGAMMLFGEKYGEEVRVVRIGGDSVELCGGIHVRRSGDIGFFKVVSDSNLAAGVRRIEAVTGLGAVRWVQSQSRLLNEAKAAMRSSAEELPERIDKLSRRARQLEKEVEEARAEAAMGGGSSKDPVEEVEEINGIRVLVKTADGTPKKALKSLADRLRDKLGSGVVVLAAREGERATVLVAATKDMAGTVHAGNVVKAATAAMGGRGGGRPDLAEGGGPAENLEAGLVAARAAISGADE